MKMFKNWFDIDNKVHRKAYLGLRKHGVWPRDIIPADVHFDSCWTVWAAEEYTRWLEARNRGLETKYTCLLDRAYGIHHIMKTPTYTRVFQSQWTFMAQICRMACHCVPFMVSGVPKRGSRITVAANHKKLLQEASDEE